MSQFRTRATLLGAVFSLAAFAQQYSDHYALILNDDPVTARYQGRDGHRTPQAQAYRRQLLSAHQSVRSAAQSRRVRPVGEVDTLLNAVFVQAAPGAAANLASIPGVKAVIRMRLARPTLSRAAALVNAPAAWTALGGQASAGAGIKIGIIDSGIDQTHPAFQDPSLKAPSGFPRCTEGYPEDCAFTNGKVIVARSYIRLAGAGSDPAHPAADSRPDDFSPRDREGHGTAVAASAAANLTAASSLSTTGGPVTISGIAPKAWLGSYKVFGSPYVTDNVSEDILIKAIEDASATDQMDVVNVSLGFAPFYAPSDKGPACGLAAGVDCDLLAAAVEKAVSIGTVVVVSAGNSGFDGENYPTFATIGSPATAPGVITVGASTNSHYFDTSLGIPGAPANLQNISSQPGDNYNDTYYYSQYALTAPLIDVSTLGNDGLACAALAPGSLQGAVALIKRGNCSIPIKEGNALDAGATGIVFYMETTATPVTPRLLNGYEPVVMVSLADGTSIKSYLAANPGALLTIDASGLEVNDSRYQNQLASLSSLGPAIDGTLKPDLVAPGASSTGYFGMFMPTQNYDRSSDLFSSSRYITAAGTSFSSPLVAGAAALVKQRHPTWSPAQIKAALVNTASPAVTTGDGLLTGSFDLVDAQWIGAGLLDAGAAIATNVLAVPASVSFGILAASPDRLTRQVTVTNTGTAAVTLTVAVVPGARSLTGNLNPAIAPTVDQTSLSLAAGASGVVNVTLTGSLPQPGSYSGAITFTATGVSLRVPYLYLAGSGQVRNIWAMPANLDGIIGQPVVNDLSIAKPMPNSTIGVMVTDAAGVPVPDVTITWRSSPARSITFSTSTSTTSKYGIAATDVTIERAGNATIDASAGSLSTSFYAYGRQLPNIPDGGVVSTGNAQPTLAPGSYVSIYGTGLSDPGYIDSAAYTPLPLAIDGVLASFDVPSAKLSLPARLVFVSPSQVNVQVPWELQGQSSAQVKVTIDAYSPSNVVTVPLADTVPEFFTDAASGIVAARDVNGVQIFTSHPAVRGQPVSLFLNGLGPVDNQPASGEVALRDPLSRTKNTAVVTVGGQDAPVQFAGLAPDYPGLYQINVTVPTGIAAGNQPVSVAIGGKTTPAKVAGANGATIVLPVQ